MATLLGRGLYTFADAAKLTGLKPSRIREWFPVRSTKRKSIFTGDYKPVNGDRAISFYDLIDVYVVGHLREHRISLQTIRKVYAKLKEEYQSDHPFCRHELLTDGKTVFVRGLDRSREKEEVMEVLTKQRVFPEILLPFLKAIEYDHAALARRWRIGKSVVINPEICFGAPVVESVGVPTSILAASYHANLENAERVARWHGVTSKDVLAAVAFESRFAA